MKAESHHILHPTAAAVTESKTSVAMATDKSQQQITFPYLDLKGMSKDEKQQLHRRLYAESVDIMFKFQDLFTETTKSLKERNVSTRDLSNHLACLGSLKPTYNDSEGSAFRHQLPQLRYTELVDDAMSEVVNEYCSFFNYHIIERIINKLGTEQDKDNLSKYKEEFAEYGKCHIFECPSEVGERSDHCVDMFVVLDKNYDNCTVSNLDLFVINLHKILNVSSGSGLKLCHIEPGSLKLTIQLPFSVLQNIFPLSSEQEAALAGLGVDNLWLIYQFNRQQYQVELELARLQL